MQFIKKLVINLPKKNMVFNSKRGKVYNKRKKGGRLNISIKDPFIKELNHGVDMLNSENLKQLVETLTLFMKASCKANVGEFLLDENFAGTGVSGSGDDSNLLR